jgi:group II intron reverse transcriptase/maturase
MDKQKLSDKLEGLRSRNQVNNNYINKDLYRILYTRDIFYIAYNSIRTNDGAETAGSDGTSLHGFCEEWVDDIITSLRDESYQPNPSRTTYIPKKNGKLRKLSFPNGKDKLVQESIRIILECIYEPSFSNLSHGFRPGRSIHSAVAQVESFRGAAWFIEGDISACFDEVDHRILESILRERISDERFIRLINKLLKAGYLDTNFSFHHTDSGAGQGSVCSPVLANIYLDKLDKYMEQVIERDTLGKYRKQNPEYARARYTLKKAKANKDKPAIKSSVKKLKTISSVDVMDPNFRRVRYVRYADDFLIGTISDKAYAVQLKAEISNFLWDVLHLRLSDEKTKITNAKHDKAKFLGFFISKSIFSSIKIEMDVENMIRKLQQNGMCDGSGRPIGVTKILQLPIEDIIKYGNQVLRGLLHSQQGCHNFYKGWRIQYIVQFSIAKTLARKFDISMKKVFRKFGKSLTASYKNAKGKVKTIALALFKSFKRDKYFFPKWLAKIKEPIVVSYDSRNFLRRTCYICDSSHQRKMFHRRRKKLIKKPYPHIITEMLRINRRQLCLCSSCFELANNNALELNQITKLRKSFRN